MTSPSPAIATEKPAGAPVLASHEARLAHTRAITAAHAVAFGAFKSAATFEAQKVAFEIANGIFQLHDEGQS